LTGVYIGQTIKTAESRWKEHLASALNGTRPREGKGALYDCIRAFGPEEFVIEEVAKAYSRLELDRLEDLYIDSSEALSKGLNQVRAPSTGRTAAIQGSVAVRGKEIHYSSRADLCRQVGVSYSSLSHRVNSMDESLAEAIEYLLQLGEKETPKIVAFRKEYSTYAELASDKKNNRLGFSSQQITARVRNGMTVEEALRTPIRKRSDIEITVNSKKLRFDSIQEAHDELKKVRGLPVYSAVVQRLEKGESPEEAFGFARRPWMKKFESELKLVDSEGYSLVGDLLSHSIPIVVHHTKEVFATKRAFAEEFGLDYTSTADFLKKGRSVEEILKASGHLK